MGSTFDPGSSWLPCRAGARTGKELPGLQLLADVEACGVGAKAYLREVNTVEIKKCHHR